MDNKAPGSGRSGGSLRVNLNRLVVIASVLLLLKLFTYIVQEFLPVFSSLLGRTISAFAPFILACILAFLVEPLVVKTINTFKIKRAPASILVILLVAIAVILILVFLGSRLYKELAELASAFPQLYTGTVNLLAEPIGRLQNYLIFNPEIQKAVASSSQNIISSLQFLLKNISLGLLAFLGAVPNLMAVIVVSVVATLLISISFPNLKQWFYSRLKGKYLHKTRSVVTDLGSALVGFLKAESILVSVTIVVTTLGLFLIGNRYAFTIGLLAGFLDLIPVIGPSLIFIPWILVLLFTSGLAAAVKVLLIYLTAAVIRQILEPKILAHNIGVNPLATLVSMYVGLNLFGALGLILGPALVVLLEALRKAGLFKI